MVKPVDHLINRGYAVSVQVLLDVASHW